MRSEKSSASCLRRFWRASISASVFVRVSTCWRQCAGIRCFGFSNFTTIFLAIVIPRSIDAWLPRAFSNTLPARMQGTGEVMHGSTPPGLPVLPLGMPTDDRHRFQIQHPPIDEILGFTVTVFVCWHLEIIASGGTMALRTTEPPLLYECMPRAWASATA